jgi:prevent-host-death family protein
MPLDSNLYDAKTHLSQLVDRALAGEEVVICRAGKRLVRLVPVDPTPPRRPGQLAGMAVPDDAMAPLTEDDAALWQ